MIVIVLSTAVRSISAPQPSGSDTNRRALVTQCRTPVTVSGAVLAPSRFELRRRVRLNELLARAGGFTERAGKTVEVTRSGPGSGCDNVLPDETSEKPGTVEVYEIEEVKRASESSNPYLHPGDFVNVPEVGIAYIIGNVMTPQPIFLRESITITGAIKLAGGVRPDSKVERVRLIRPHPFADFAATEIIVDLQAIKKGRARDMLIQQHDIVEVGSKKGRRGVRPFPISMPVPPKLPLRIVY